MASAQVRLAAAQAHAFELTAPSPALPSAVGLSSPPLPPHAPEKVDTELDMRVLVLGFELAAARLPEHPPTSHPLTRALRSLPAASG